MIARLLYAASSLGLAAAEAQARDGPAQGNETANAAVPEIIVTARRQEEPLSDAAVPVSVLGGRAVFDDGITSLDRLADRFPALTVQSNSTGNLLFIRGVGNFSLTPNSEPAVGFNYDGVFVARPIGTNGQLFDLERIELLKGPQGVLYGRNASAGTLNIVPRHPVLGENAAYVSGSLGGHDTRSAEAAVNVALGKSGALRVSGAFTDQDNFSEGYPDGPSQRSLRVQLGADLTPDLALRVAADYVHLGGTGLGSPCVSPIGCGSERARGSPATASASRAP